MWRRPTCTIATTLCTAFWLASSGLVAPTLAADDPVAALARMLPAEVEALKRVSGPAESDTSFLLIRESARDRLFVLRKTGTPAPSVVEITDLAALDGRVADIRSEADAEGLVAFVDVVTAGQEETTYELFLEKEDPTAYLFQPASN